MGRSRKEKYLVEDRDNDSGSDSSRSRSGSAKSRTGSPAGSRSGSRSKSPSRSRSRSGSARSRGSGSPKSGSRSRSRSGSPKNNSDSAGESEKKRRMSDDESDTNKKSGDGSKSPEVGAEDLFGDDLSVSSEDESDKAAKKKVIDSDGDDVARYDDDDAGNKRRAIIGSDSDDDDSEEKKRDEEEKEPQRYDDKPDEEPVPETRIDVEVPKINTNLGKEIHFVKLPNFLSMEARPFDPKTYEDEMDDDSNQQDEEGRTRLKLKVENTIRWRQHFDKDLNVVKQSNARMVKWSDGSYSLHLGNEIFDVHKQPLQSDFNHLFIRQGTGLQGQAVFRTKLSFRPHSVDSHTHKKMTLSMADRSSKSNQIKVISHVGNNPEEGRWEKIRKEEQGLRMAMRADTSKNRVR